MTRKVGGVHMRDTFAHEQCLVITQGRQHVLVSGCAHNGILNIVDRYKEMLGSYPDVVISGFHMIQKNEYTNQDIDIIKETAHALMETGAIYFSGHCTGTFAYGIMKEIMGKKLQSIHSGKRLV
jgi:7,8-dihydropterin-6-yl-methyl-4-(beta-D-ribofuranosyl)aminobenzene 5'-phosphate synthase